MIGHDPVGKLCYKEFHGFDKPCDFCTNDIILKNREPYTWEYYNQMLEKHFLITDQILTWIDGRQVRLELARDITEQKRSKAELHLKNLVFETAISANSVADNDGVIYYMNDAFLKLWGYKSKKEATGNTIVDFFVNHEEAVPILEALNTKGIWEGEFQAKRNDGSTFISHGLATVIRDADGNQIGYQSANIDVTESKHSEEEKNRILNLSHDLICIAGTEGYFNYVNPAWEKTLGYSTEELLSRPYLDFIHPDDHEINDAEVESLSRGEQTIGFENRYIHKDGSIRYINWVATPAKEENAMYCIGRDVTDRKQAENDLADEKAKLDKIISELSVGISVYDETGQCVLANNAIAKQIGAEKKEDLLVQNYNNIESWKKSGLVDTAKKAVNENSIQRKPELKVKTTFGNEVVLDCYFIPFSLGEKTNLLFTSYDIKEIKLAEEELKRHRDNLEQMVEERTTELTESDKELRKLSAEQQLILDTVPATIWYKDLENNVLRVNRAGAESVGMRVEDIEGKSTYDLFPEEAEKYFKDDLEVINSGKPKFGIVEQLQTSSGDKIWVRTDKVLSRDDNGEIIGLIAFATDITDQKRAEETINKSNIELKATNKELESFAYSVSHDLRAPLRTIHGFSQALIEDNYEKLDEQSKKYLDRVSKAALKMGQLIDDLLKLSRITRAEMKIEEVGFSNLTRKVANDLKNNTPDRQVEFDIQDEMVLNADIKLIEVVLDNLLGNALKFTGKNPNAKIEVGSKIINGQTEYFVRDNGVGFNMKYSNKLFGAFQRLHSDYEFEGTGIGLATVARIIHRHGGQVRAEAELEKGAVFYFTL
jgi:PAS domain S-box-containing protein